MDIAGRPGVQGTVLAFAHLLGRLMSVHFSARKVPSRLYWLHRGNRVDRTGRNA